MSKPSTSHGRSIAIAVATMLAVGIFNQADAAIVEIAFSGSTDGASGLTYPAGGTFDGRIVYDTDAVDDSGSPSFGSFSVSPTLIELNTPLGSLSFAPDPSRQAANIMTFTQQENLAGQQTSRLSFGSNEFDYDGFDGALAGYTPISFDLVLQTIPGPGGDVLFSDPNVLLSGAGSLISAALINSVIQVVFTNDAMNNYGVTGLAIGSASFNILGDGGPPAGEVPVPGAAALLLTGMGGFLAARRRRKNKADALQGLNALRERAGKS